MIEITEETLKWAFYKLKRYSFNEKSNYLKKEMVRMIK